MPNELNIVLFAILVMLWGSAAWLWRLRDHPEKLNKLLPMMSKYRKSRLHPLFGSREVVLGLAGWFFGIGLLILGLLLMRMC
jgi:hypothetical protein